VKSSSVNSSQSGLCTVLVVELFEACY
jgi:hypothetical protein